MDYFESFVAIAVITLISFEEFVWGKDSSLFK